MMMQIKVMCGCGQKYAFDVEPVNGRMPYAVACPICSADGTGAANESIAQALAAQPVVAPAPYAPPAPVAVAPAPAPVAPAGGALRMRVATAPAPAPAPVPVAAPPAPAAAPRGRPGRIPGQLDPEQAQHEARAKIMWGDPQEEVVKFLMIQGFNLADARSLVGELFQERVKALRSKGVGKIIMGVLLVCVPTATIIVCLIIGIFFVTILGVAGVFGLYGIYQILTGILMIASPKTQRGEV